MLLLIQAHVPMQTDVARCRFTLTNSSASRGAARLVTDCTLTLIIQRLPRHYRDLFENRPIILNVHLRPPKWESDFVLPPPQESWTHTFALQPKGFFPPFLHQRPTPQQSYLGNTIGIRDDVISR